MFKKLKNIRAERNISAEEVAKIIGLKTKAAYYKKESGNVKFTLLEAKKISNFLKMSIEDIFFVD